MHRRWKYIAVLSLLLGACFSSTEKPAADNKPKDPDQKRTTNTEYEMPVIDGTVVFNSDSGTASIDASHTEDGYVAVKDTASTDKVQIQVTNPDGSMYPYPLIMGDYQVLPLTNGDGTYQIKVLEHLSDKQYALALYQSIDVQEKDEFQPYLVPSQYVNYKPDSACVALAAQLSDESSDDLDYVGKVYDYVTRNIAYDTELAENLSVNYIPDPDATLSSKKGICFDYASLMTAMLRCQLIPTRLEVGYSGTIYHAWISVYLKETGWVENIIEFNGKDWTLVDPTLGASNKPSDVKKYISDGSNYTVKYHY